jgi:hypothetical protein
VRRALLSVIMAMLWSSVLSAQFQQQGDKLVASSAIGKAHQGWSTALSADGNTALVGGYMDGAGLGAAWVFTRSGSVWSQQAKLVGSSAVGDSMQGWSAALSADGNTAAVGGRWDSNGIGAIWIFTRSGVTWTQQAKLVASDYGGTPQIGYAVSLSADGNTLLAGGSGNNGNVGAAWVFTRSGGVWTQQGDKLVGTGAVGQAQQGSSVGLSGDGLTAIVGGNHDNDPVGAAWVFARTGGVWTQQGDKLVGSDMVGSSLLGGSVTLSYDGSTAAAGGQADNAKGAVWVFTRSGGAWTQQGSKLTGSPNTVGAFGFSVALSNDGNTLFVGSVSGPGAAWAFTRSGTAWTQLGGQMAGTGAEGTAQAGQSVSLSGDGTTALVGGPSDNNVVGAVWVFTTVRAAIYVPSAAHLEGIPPTFWKTRFEVHNRGTVQARYTLALLPRDEEGTNPQTANFLLDPGKSVKSSDVLGAIFGFSGAATLRVSVMSGDLLVSARTYNDQPTGTYGQFIPGVGDDKAIKENQEVRLVQLAYSPDATTGFRTNIGVVSASSVPITVTVDLYNGGGAQLGRRTFDLDPFESKQETNSYSKVTTGAVDPGYAVVKSVSPGARYFAYASVVDNRTGDPIYVPAQ